MYTLYETLVYLMVEYKKALVYYDKKQKKRKAYRDTKKEEVFKNVIKDNVTKIINAKKINEQIGYAMLSFVGRNENTTDTKMQKEKVNVGRSRDNDIVVNDLTVSRQQCLIVKKGYKFYICNLSNTNKTLLNGVPVDNTMEIKYGDIVEIGEITFRFNDVLQAI